MGQKKSLLWIIIGILCFLFIRSCQNAKEFKRLEEQQKQTINPTIDSALLKKEAMYNALTKEIDGNFVYMRSSLYTHKDKSNSISVYIKYNHTISKPFLFMKISGCTHATQIKTIYLNFDGGAEKIEHINDVYPLSASVENAKMYGTLDISIGDILTDALWRMAQSEKASVAFVGKGIFDEFSISDKEKQALNQVIMAYQFLSKK